MDNIIFACQEAANAFLRGARSPFALCLLLVAAASMRRVEEEEDRLAGPGPGPVQGGQAFIRRPGQNKSDV